MAIAISEIKNEYKSISEYAVMDYEKEMKALEAFIDKYKIDKRTGVQSVVTSADKRLGKLNAEIERVQSMMIYERENRELYHRICGVDEVGRGPLAGPIVTAAVILPEDFIIPYINDSKKLNEKRREELFEIITENAISFAYGIKSEKEIDEIGVGKADSLAMKEAVLSLDTPADMVLVDAFPIPGIDVKQIPIIKGDAKSVSIAAASIIAKVTRDRMMKEYSEKYPEYGFDSNKGYGSADHIAAIKKYGPCDIHRRSFISNFV